MKKVIITAIAISTLFIGCGDTKKSPDEKKPEVKPQLETSVSPVKVEQPKEVVEQKIQEIEQKAKEKVEAKVQDVKKEVQAKISSSSDGAALFTPCKGCHGTDASKKALGKSAVIKGWDENKIFEALNGYKNGTYGGTMKGLMVGQVKSLSEDKLKSLAKYISTL